jgi:tetratricopeptide (TPR) repeat protein
MWGQNDNMSQEEVKFQSKYIDAEKFILLGDFENAESILLDLKSKLPENGAVMYQLARISHAMKNSETAISRVNEAIALDPENEWYLQFKANVAESYEMYEVAASTYQDLVELKPQRTNYYKSWSFYELKNGNREKAIQVLNQLENKIGIDPEVSQRKHQMYVVGGMEQKALEELANVAVAFPENTNHLENLALFYEELADQESAIVTYNSILEIDPDHPRAAVRIAMLSDNDENSDAGLKILQVLADNVNIPLDDKVSQIIPYIQSFAHTKESDLGDNLLSITNALESTHPASPKIDAMRGDILYHMGKLPESIVAYKASLDKYDGVYNVWEQLMYALYESSQFDVLKDYAEDAIDLFPNKASAYYLHGRALEHSGSFDLALRDCSRGIMIAARNKYQQAEIYNLKGDLLLAKGDVTGAVSAWERSMATGYKLEGILGKIDKYANNN